MLRCFSTFLASGPLAPFATGRLQAELLCHSFTCRSKLTEYVEVIHDSAKSEIVQGAVIINSAEDNMANIHSLVGIIERENKRVFIRTSNSETGPVVFGPYHELGKGRYSVNFKIKPEEGAARDLICCRVDIAADYGQTTISERMLSVGELRDSNNEIEVEFELPAPAIVEYRVFSLGTAGLCVAYDRKLNVSLDHTSDFSFLSAAKYASDNEILRANYARISYLARIGVEFSVDEEEIIATFDRLKLFITSDEDVTLITDIFINNCYTAYLPRKCIAIDIGMNVGMASLAFAGNPMVERVYAFEPFAVPFGRALRNFELNAARSQKIIPYNFGLSDSDANLEVLSQDQNTMGTSVRGLETGNKETIQLRDAARELKKFLAEAHRDGLGVFVKMDCEGSEFPIFEALEREDLLKSIDVIVMEWHIWWSKQKTQHDLIRPLVKSGFAVFDRTPVDDRFAGIVLAVKTAQA